MATSVVAIFSARYQLHPQLVRVHLNLHAEFKISKCCYANVYFF